MTSKTPSKADKPFTDETLKVFIEEIGTYNLCHCGAKLPIFTGYPITCEFCETPFIQ